MGVKEIDQGYEGYNVYCAGTICIYKNFKWVEWDKRTPRIAEKNRRKKEFLQKIKKREKMRLK